MERKDTETTFIVSRPTKTAVEIRQNWNAANNKFKLFLCSDIHLDNRKCRRDKFVADLKRAVEENSPIMIFGDLLCLMQGKFDPRSSKHSLMERHIHGDSYILSVVEDAFEVLKPFAPHLVLISNGNHETGVASRIEINPLALLVEKLKNVGSSVEHMPYQGWAVFKFVRDTSGGGVRTFKMFYHHGAFGGVVSKGVQAVDRFASVAPDADAVVTGHTHDRWAVTKPVFRLKQNYEQVVAEQLHIKTGTYKEEFEKGEGWAVEKLVIPKSIGGVELFLEVGEDGIECRALV